MCTQRPVHDILNASSCCTLTLFALPENSLSWPVLPECVGRRGASPTVRTGRLGTTPLGAGTRCWLCLRPSWRDDSFVKAGTCSLDAPSGLAGGGTRPLCAGVFWVSSADRGGTTSARALGCVRHIDRKYEPWSSTTVWDWLGWLPEPCTCWVSSRGVQQRNAGGRGLVRGALAHPCSVREAQGFKWQLIPVLWAPGLCT